METKLFKSIPSYHSSLLSDLRNDDLHSDAVLVSDDKSVTVHAGILSNSSRFLRNLLVATSSKTIVLPGFSSVLPEFVTLLYTGTVIDMTMQESELLVLLCTQLGIGTRDSLRITTSIDGLVESQILTNFKKFECLKVDKERINVVTNEKFTLRLPSSRIDRCKLNTKIMFHKFEGFKGSIQNEYNNSPVGPYEGPFDQNPEVPLSAQLPKSKLTYKKYTGFSHPQIVNCKRFQIKENFEDIDDHNVSIQIHHTNAAEKPYNPLFLGGAKSKFN